MLIIIFCFSEGESERGNNHSQSLDKSTQYHGIYWWKNKEENKVYLVDYYNFYL